MTWLYVPGLVPGTSCPSAPASEALSSASELPNPERAASCTWRGKPQPPQAWSRAWKRGGFIRLLSGLTQEPSTLDLGVGAFIASLPETPANRTASPASDRARATSAGLSTSCFASSRSAGLIVSSARTSRGTSTASSPPSSQHWKAWAIALRAESSARPASVPATGASASSSWPTATSRDFAEQMWQPPATDSFRSRGGDRKHEMGLDQQARTFREWRTPQAGDSTRGAKSQRAARYGYRDQAGRHSLVSEVAHWPTPAARDHKGANSAEHVTTNGSGRMHMDQLPNFVAHAFPPSPLDPATPAGPTSSPERRILNPLFVEWLMGWPIGLSGFERSGTEFARWLQQMRGCLLTLCSAPVASQGQLL